MYELDGKTPEEKLFHIDLAFSNDEKAKRANRCSLKLYLIRHAQSQMNTHAQFICGRSNSTPLTKKGRVQAFALGQRFAAQNIRFDEVWSSTAIRAKETAQIACEVIGYHHSKILESDQILELCQGEFTHKPREKVYTKEVMQRINKESVFFRPPGVDKTDESLGAKHPPGESQYDVEVRVSAFMHKLLDFPRSKNSEHKKTVAVFMHGFAIRCFLRRVIQAGKGFSQHIYLGNAGITELEYRLIEGNRGGWAVLGINDGAHIKSPWFDSLVTKSRISRLDDDFKNKGIAKVSID